MFLVTFQLFLTLERPIRVPTCWQRRVLVLMGILLSGEIDNYLVPLMFLRFLSGVFVSLVWPFGVVKVAVVCAVCQVAGGLFVAAGCFCSFSLVFGPLAFVVRLLPFFCFSIKFCR